ncbi:hypothetical protein AB0C07_20555 [Actinoplanes missouriensis]|uniref:hypothetical protein n=1 Tax=Actinoplanes missouriensis TaxID=1866 RepID=UPI0034042CD8
MGMLRTAIFAVLSGSLTLSAASPAPAAEVTVSSGAVFTSAAGQVLHGTATITADGLPGDATGVVLIWGGREISRATAKPWALTWDTRKTFGYAVSGDYRLKLVVTDRSGNTTARHEWFRVDNAGPEIDATGFPARIGPGQAELAVRVRDASRTARIEWWVDGELRGTGERYRADLGPGPVQVTVQAWDRVGNVTSLTREVRPD